MNKRTPVSLRPSSRIVIHIELGSELLIPIGGLLYSLPCLLTDIQLPPQAATLLKLLEVLLLR